MFVGDALEGDGACPDNFKGFRPIKAELGTDRHDAFFAQVRHHMCRGTEEGDQEWLAA